MEGGRGCSLAGPLPLSATVVDNYKVEWPQVHRSVGHIHNYLDTWNYTIVALKVFLSVVMHLGCLTVSPCHQFIKLAIVLNQYGENMSTLIAHV